MRRYIAVCAGVVAVCRLAAAAATFDVRDFGAKGDGAAKDTAALQKAIDAAGQQGGTVLVPPGKYLSGTIHLRSNVTLHLAPGSVILASPDEARFRSLRNAARFNPSPIKKPRISTTAW